MYDLIIIGGGPAGVSAGIYASRKRINTVIITESFGGQSIVSDSIENWIGSVSISGLDLAKSLETHLKAQEHIDIIEGERAVSVKKTDIGFEVGMSSGKILETKTILMATGGRHRRLEVPGEAKFEGKGVVFCATCDAPLFKNKTVIIVGGGNSALESVEDVARYASKIYLLVRGDSIRGDQETLEDVKKIEGLEIIYNGTTKEVLGDDLVTGIKYIDLKTSEEKEIKADGVFVEIGTVPNSDIVKDLVDLSPRGEIKVDSRNGASSLEGIWAAGDVSDTFYNQNNVAVGDAIRALLNINDWLNAKRKK